jgi:hypothetical protein
MKTSLLIMGISMYIAFTSFKFYINPDKTISKNICPYIFLMNVDFINGKILDDFQLLSLFWFVLGLLSDWVIFWKFSSFNMLLLFYFVIIGVPLIIMNVFRK